MVDTVREIADRTLPESLRGLFPEYRFEDLSLAEDRDLVIGRVLARGTWKAVTWARRQVGDGGLREWIVRRQGRGLSRQQIRYWELILDLDPAAVETWLAAPGRAVWDGRLRNTEGEPGRA